MVSPTGSETSGSRYFGARHRTKINQQVATYNRSPAAGAECTAEEAQQGLKDLFSIQQQALRWMEGLGNRQDAKRVGIADWHQQQYMPEQDRLEQRFLAQSDLAATLPELTDRTGGLGGKAASARARDRRFNGAGWEVINSETFQVTAEEGLTVYRMVNTTSEAPELVPSYDPRGPRSIRSQEPTASDMMSYGHVYFAPNKNLRPVPDLSGPNAAHRVGHLHASAGLQVQARSGDTRRVQGHDGHAGPGQRQDGVVPHASSARWRWQASSRTRRYLYGARNCGWKRSTAPDVKDGPLGGPSLR